MKQPAGTAKPAAPGVALPVLAADKAPERPGDYVVPERPPLPTDLPLPFATAPGSLPPEHGAEPGSGEGVASSAGPPPRPPIDKLTLVESTLPDYPKRARTRGVEAYVVVEFVVDRDGRVHDPRVVVAHPLGYFEQTALDAILGWRYVPVKRDGVAIEVAARQRIEFRLVSSESR